MKILLVGDNGIDQYQYGTVTRISPEAPVPVVNYTHTDTRPGMAANVRDNLEQLGCEVEFVHGVKTCIKTRVIDSRTKQHLVRIDQDMTSGGPPAIMRVRQNTTRSCRTATPPRRAQSPAIGGKAGTTPTPRPRRN